MSFHKPQRWAPVSQGLVATEWRGLQRGLVITAPFWEGGGAPYDYQGRRFSTVTGPTWGAGPYGLKMTFAGSNHRVEWADVGDLADLTGDLSILVVWKRDTGTNWRTLAGRRAGGTGDASFLCNFNQSNGVQWGHGAGGAFDLIITASGDVPAVGQWTAMVCTRVKGGVNRIFLDGVEKASGTLTKTPIDIALPVQLGVFNTTSEDFAGDMALFMLWKRALSPGEAIAISRDPFGPIRMWRPSSASVIAAAAANTRRYTLPILGVG